LQSFIFSPINLILTDKIICRERFAVSVESFLLDKFY